MTAWVLPKMLLEVDQAVGEIWETSGMLVDMIRKHLSCPLSFVASGYSVILFLRKDRQILLVLEYPHYGLSTASSVSRIWKLHLSCLCNTFRPLCFKECIPIIIWNLRVGLCSIVV